VVTKVLALVVVFVAVLVAEADRDLVETAVVLSTRSLVEVAADALVASVAVLDTRAADEE